MTVMTRLCVSVLLILSLAAQGPAAQGPSFTREVAPLLRTHCLKCHSGKRPRGELDLSSHKGLLAGSVNGAVVKPGKAGDSLLHHLTRDGKMPPRQPLAKADVEVLRRWIDAGARW